MKRLVVFVISAFLASSLFAAFDISADDLALGGILEDSSYDDVDLIVGTGSASVTQSPLPVADGDSLFRQVLMLIGDSHLSFSVSAGDELRAIVGVPRDGRAAVVELSTGAETERIGGRSQDGASAEIVHAFDSDSLCTLSADGSLMLYSLTLSSQEE